MPATTDTLLLHVDLVVKSIERSLAFYVDLLGARVVEDTVVQGTLPQFYSGGAADSMRLVMLRLPCGRFQLGHMIELLELLPRDGATPDAANPGRAPAWNLTLSVQNLDETVATLAGAGVELLVPPTVIELPKLGRARLILARDPDGNLVEIVQPA